jgi:nicotinamidase-related amidase
LLHIEKEQIMKSALLVIDVQRDVVANAFRRDAVIANIAGLVNRVRKEGAPVIWVQHSDDELVKGSEGWAYVDELRIGDGEPVVHKQFGDSFEGTNLDELLQDLSVDHLVVCGAQTDACIRSTLHGALARGYNATLVLDAHTTDDCTWATPPLTAEQVIAHTNFYWKWQRTPRAAGGTSLAAEVVFAS